MFASISSFFFGLFGANWEAVDKKIKNEYPSVEFVSTDYLLQRYGQLDLSFPVIIDVREFEEFQVSHLQNAINLETGESISALFESRGLNKDAPIIVYCSVGYRSAAVASALQQLGFTEVRNLRHSIFEWANKDYPMINNEGDTDKIHPFNKAWGVLVDESRHSYSFK